MAASERCINESGRLISDLLRVTKKMQVKSYLVKIDIEKATDSLDHTFLIRAPETFGFGKIFIDWIKIFLNEQESWVINGEITKKYFKLKKGATMPTCDTLSFYTLFRYTFHVNKKQKY